MRPLLCHLWLGFQDKDFAKFLGLLLQIAQTYLQDLLNYYWAQSLTTMINHKKFIIVRDNVFLHTSKEVKDYKTDTEVIIIQLTLILYVWILPNEWVCILKRRFQK